MLKLKLLFLAVIGFLAACNSPSPAFYGADKRVIDVDGSTFLVWVKGGRAQAIRTNIERKPKEADVFPKAAVAMEQTSGCRVMPTTLAGDPALVTAQLDCAWEERRQRSQ